MVGGNTMFVSYNEVTYLNEHLYLSLHHYTERKDKKASRHYAHTSDTEIK